jgi:hypothetical protein
MADSSLPVAPAPAPGAPVPVPMAVKTFTVIDNTGTLVQIQGVVLVDENGRTITPMTEQTGQALLMAIRQLHSDFANTGNGMLGPSGGNDPSSAVPSL